MMKVIKNKELNKDHLVYNLRYDPKLVDRIEDKKQESKRFFSLLVMCVVLSSLIFIIANFNPEITGEVVYSGGCCETYCQVIGEDMCPGEMHYGQECSQIAECNVGCCIDNEGYCLNNYLYGSCSSKGYNFVSTDCSNVYNCTMSLSQPSVRENTGYDLVFNRSEIGEGFGLVNPPSQIYGRESNVGYYVYDKTNIAEIKARIYDGNVAIDEFYLYDDGNTEDYNTDDNFYSYSWSTTRAGSFSGLKKFYVEYHIQTNDNNKTIKQNESSITVVRDTICAPIKYEWQDPSQKSDIIFVNKGLNNDDFDDHVDIIIEKLWKNTLFESYRDSFNFYRIDKSYNDITSIENEVMSECYFFNSSEDILFVLDETQGICIKQNGMAIVTPDLVFADPNPFRNYVPDISNASAVIRDLCYFIVTEELINNATGGNNFAPNIEILTDDGTLFYNNEIKIDIIIEDSDDPTITYEAYAVRYDLDVITAMTGRTKAELIDMNDDQLSSLLDSVGYVASEIKRYGSSQDGVEEEIVFGSVSDGMYDIWVVVRDSGGNMVSSDIITIEVTTPDFNANLISPVGSVNISHKDVSLSFNVSHPNEATVEYKIFVNNIFQLNGDINVGEIKIENITLSEGYNEIRLKMEDSVGELSNDYVNIFVDSIPPVINQFEINNGTEVMFSISDNDPMLNYSIYVNDSIVNEGYVVSWDVSFVNLSLINGTYEVRIEAYDDLGNMVNVSLITNVMLLAPRKIGMYEFMLLFVVVILIFLLSVTIILHNKR